MGLRKDIADALTAHHIDPERTDADRNDICVCGGWSSGPMNPGWDDHLVDAVMKVVEARLSELETAAREDYSDDPWDHGYLRAIKDMRGGK